MLCAPALLIWTLSEKENRGQYVAIYWVLIAAIFVASAFNKHPVISSLIAFSVALSVNLYSVKKSKDENLSEKVGEAVAKSIKFTAIILIVSLLAGKIFPGKTHDGYDNCEIRMCR